MTAEEYFEYDQNQLPFLECSTKEAEGYDYDGEEPAYSKYEMIAFAKGYHKKQLDLCGVVKSLVCERCKQPNDNDCSICYDCTEEIQKLT